MALENKPKIAIHGIGNVGCRLIRFCNMKGLEVVAAYNRSGDKVGKDIGTLAGLNKTLGVRVEDVSRARFDQLDANIMLNTAGDYLDQNWPFYERVLGAGINLISHSTQSYNPFFENPGIAEKIDRLAKAKGVTFCGAAIWDSTRIWPAIVAAGTCLEIDSVVHTAHAEIGRQGAQFERLCAGVGLSMAEYMSGFANVETPYTLSRFTHGPVVMLLQHLGCTVLSVNKFDEPITFDEAVYSPYSKQEFAAGTVVGTRNNIEVQTAEGIVGKACMEYRLFKENEAEILRWDINGMPGLSVSVERKDTANLSAASLFNRIADVLRAPAGIVEITKLGPLKSSALL